MNLYNEYIVAFLDILGFKNIINSEEFEKIRDIFSAILSEKSAITRLCKEGNPTENSLAQYNNILLQHLKIRIMSDSIVVAAPSQYPESLAVVINVCIAIQDSLFSLERPVFLRGAIAKGDFYVDENTIFGKALVDAYIAQENYAIYPRIILSNDVQRGMKTGINNEQNLLIDDDGYSYINTLEHYINWGPSEKICDNKRYVKIKNTIDQQLSGYADNSLRKKYLWLKKNLEDIEEKASCF